MMREATSQKFNRRREMAVENKPPGTTRNKGRHPRNHLLFPHIPPLPPQSKFGDGSRNGRCEARTGAGETRTVRAT